MATPIMLDPWPVATGFDPGLPRTTNLAPNPSAETTIGPVTSVTSSSAGLTAVAWTRDNTGWAKAGTYSRRHQFFRNDAIPNSFILGSLPTGLSGIPVTPGRYYAARLVVYIEKMDVPITGLRAQVYWYKADGAGSAVTVNSSGPLSDPVLATEESRVVVALAPSDAAFVSLRLRGVLNPGGVTREFITRSDAYALFDLGTTPPPRTDAATLDSDVPAYGDGDMPGYVWEGTPHASRSIPASSARTQLNLNSGTIRVRPDGPDWGESSVEPQMAQGAFGAVPLGAADVPNRQVTIPVTLGMDGGAGYAQAKKALQAKVARFQTEGGWIQRDVDGLYGDVVGASLKLADKYSHLQVNEADLALDVLPDWYGAEIALDPIVSTGPDLVGVLKQGGVQAVIGGDYPARCRIEVVNGSASDQLGLLFGLRCRHYSAAATAALAYAAQSLTPLDTAVNATVASTACVSHSNLSTSWTPVLGTNLTAGTFLTHEGSYRVWARVYSTSPVPPSVRLVWDVGDLTLPVENKPVAIPGANDFYLLDLGEIRLDRGPGAHRWAGQVQARGADGGENVSVARLELVPLDESAAVLRGTPESPSIQPPISRDEFNQTAGVLAGKAAATGGTWSGAGDADDFSVVAGTSKLLRRTATGDAANTGRWARLGTSTTANVEVSVAVRVADNVIDGLFGVFARYVDVNNWVGAFVSGATGGEVIAGAIAKRVGGVLTTLSTVQVARRSPGYFAPVALTVIGALAKTGWGSQVSDPDLAPGGALASGGHGIYDYISSGSGNRDYDNFRVEPVLGDPVLAASRTAELSTAGMARQDSTGTAYGPVSHTTGDLPRLPPSGLEGRPVELFLKGSRGDLGQLPDSSASDGLTARVYARPTFIAP